MREPLMVKFEFTREEMELLRGALSRHSAESEFKTDKVMAQSLLARFLRKYEERNLGNSFVHAPNVEGIARDLRKMADENEHTNSGPVLLLEDAAGYLEILARAAERWQIPLESK